MQFALCCHDGTFIFIVRDSFYKFNLFSRGDSLSIRASLLHPNACETGAVLAYNNVELLFCHAQLDGTAILPTPCLSGHCVLSLLVCRFPQFTVPPRVFFLCALFLDFPLFAT
jgi:hypothetical protein